jgi:hypothetical protein
VSGWIKMLNTFRSHPKVVPVGDGAFRLYVDGLCWCNEHLTDGTIPEHMLAVIAPGLRANAKRAAGELVAAGLWHGVEGGWVVHNYLKVQTSAEKVAVSKAKAAERMAALRAGQNGGVR